MRPEYTFHAYRFGLASYTKGKQSEIIEFLPQSEGPPKGEELTSRIWAHMSLMNGKISSTEVGTTSRPS
jgi:hypothetical protein